MVRVDMSEQTTDWALEIARRDYEQLLEEKDVLIQRLCGVQEALKVLEERLGPTVTRMVLWPDE